jgi:hypothetical protein
MGRLAKDDLFPFRAMTCYCLSILIPRGRKGAGTRGKCYLAEKQGMTGSTESRTGRRHPMASSEEPTSYRLADGGCGSTSDDSGLDGLRSPGL